VDYESIKALAKARGVPVPRMLALAVQNDPFYVGMPAQRKAGEWFAERFHAAGFGEGVHLRRVHYHLVSVEATLPDGKPYENTIEAWQILGQASKAARYLGLVDLAAFDDRRNPPAQIFEPQRDEGGVHVENVVPEVPQLTMPALPALCVERPSADQPYALEIWCEKSTMNDVLLPLCRRFSATLVTGLGELSVTACQRLVERAQESGKPTRIVYLSDFDPAGQSMPVAAARKIEFLARDHDLDVRLYAVALTASQIQMFNLPRVPIKESERRREAFENTHGVGAVELDALEALVPGELARIVTEALLPFFDDTLDDEIGEAYMHAAERAEHVTYRTYEAYDDEIAAARREWQAISAQIQQWRQRHAGTWTTIAEALENVDLGVEFPAADVSGDAGWPLFDSRRAYEEQLQAYQAFRAGAAA
jgi:hypothetical protein